MNFFKKLIDRYLSYQAEKLTKEHARKIGDKPTIFNKEVERQTGIEGVLFVERIGNLMFLSQEQIIQLVQSIDNNSYVPNNYSMENTDAPDTKGAILSVEKAHTKSDSYICVFYWGDVGNIHVIHWKKLKSKAEEGGDIIGDG
ncbi:MAG: hypothetical protein IT258_00490 [Saprospiraceae bacterium]|nr:hypothetical protein [Saprospiraceae bacterium]